MKYYKIIVDKSFIGVVCSGQFVVEDTETNKLFFANDTNGQFVSYQGILYRDYWMSPIVTDKTYTNANISEITEDEYNTYKEAIEKNEVIEEDEEEEIVPVITPIEEINESIEFLRSSKLNEMSYECRKTIETGIDIELYGETQHFSLDTQDQLNLMNLNTLADTEDFIPYHADGKECRFYTAQEIKQIAAKATKFKMYQTTYFNSLKNYINSLETIEEIAAVTYGMEIPEEYKTEVLKTLEV